MGAGWKTGSSGFAVFAFCWRLLMAGVASKGGILVILWRISYSNWFARDYLRWPEIIGELELIGYRFRNASGGILNQSDKCDINIRNNMLKNGE